MNQVCKLFLWKFYTWICNIEYTILEFLPLGLRTLCLRPFFGKIGKHVNLIDYKTYFRYPSKMHIGDYVTINRGCFFLATMHSGVFLGGGRKNADIIIGDHVLFAPNVKLLCGGHDYSTLDMPVIADKIIIENYVWIGEGATILPGVRIHEGSVIGAGSVVTHDVPGWAVYAGNPARQIGVRSLDKEHVRK